MIYGVDIDGILTLPNEKWGAAACRNAQPNLRNIGLVNALFAGGHVVILHTARQTSDLGVKRATKRWLKRYGVKYTRLVFNKPICDIYIDDKATCNFPDNRSLHFLVTTPSSTHNMTFYFYLWHEKLDTPDIRKVPDFYIIELQGNGLNVAAQGEFIRDADLKMEALEFWKLEMNMRAVSSQRISAKLDAALIMPGGGTS